MINDKYGLLEGLDNTCNYRVLLALALEATRGSAHPVIELGPSPGSTTHLHAYCEGEGRSLVTVEEDISRIGAYVPLSTARHEVRWVSWDAFPVEAGLWSVALINHAPGERRVRDIERLMDRCEVVVVHDTEPAADYGYKFSAVLPKFRSRVDVRSDGAWSSAVSMTRDLTRWRGFRAERYVVSHAGDDARPDAAGEAVERAIAWAENQFDE